MIRGVLETILRDHLWWFFGPIAALFAAVAAPSSDLFGRAAATTSSTAWKSPEGIIGLGATAAFIGVSILTAAAIVRLLGWIFKIPLDQLGLRLTRLLRYAIGIVIVAVAWVAVDTFDPVRTGARLKDNIDVLGQIVTGETGIDVTLDAMLWGLTDSPLVEFVALVAIVITAGSFAINRRYDVPLLWVVSGSVMVSFGVTALAAVTGTQVFPLELQFAFGFTVLVLWGVLALVVMAVDRFIHEIEASTPMIDEGGAPRNRYQVFDAGVLVILFGLMGSPFSGLIGWVAWRLWRIGGWASLKQKYSPPTDDPDPEPVPDLEMEELDE